MSGQQSKNVEIISPLEKMTDAELQAKVDELHALAEAEFRHATEIRRYADLRRRSEAEPEQHIALAQEHNELAQHYRERAFERFGEKID